MNIPEQCVECKNVASDGAVAVLRHVAHIDAPEMLKRVDSINESLAHRVPRPLPKFFPPDIPLAVIILFTVISFCIIFFIDFFIYQIFLIVFIFYSVTKHAGDALSRGVLLEGEIVRYKILKFPFLRKFASLTLTYNTPKGITSEYSFWIPKDKLKYFIESDKLDILYLAFYEGVFVPMEYIVRTKGKTE